MCGSFLKCMIHMSLTNKKINVKEIIRKFDLIKELMLKRGLEMKCYITLVLYYNPLQVATFNIHPPSEKNKK